MALSEEGIFTQIYFSELDIRGWLNNNATESDVNIFMEMIEPLIIKLWQEKNWRDVLGCFLINHQVVLL